MAAGGQLPEIKALFWDVGGVLLTDAWDHTQRGKALARFALDHTEFEVRHQAVVAAFERGEMNLDAYLDKTVFYESRPFTREAFRECMFSMSQPKESSLQASRELAKSGKYLMATINNESLELNQYRVQTFGLREIFTVFVSSCYVRLRKPDEAIYRLALQLTQKSAAECCFLDDRLPNLESAAKIGMQVIQVKDAAQMSSELAKLGVVA
jgi:putative hydrolase of the HAD superfamily